MPDYIVTSFHFIILSLSQYLEWRMHINIYARSVWSYFFIYFKMSVAGTTKLVFRYWNCRGRAQTVRYMLEDIAYKNPGNVEYTDQPELLEKALETWFPNKDNEAITGPFHTLPVLNWNNEHTFGQTLTIGVLN